MRSFSTGGRRKQRIFGRPEGLWMHKLSRTPSSKELQPLSLPPWGGFHAAVSLPSSRGVPPSYRSPGSGHLQGAAPRCAGDGPARAEAAALRLSRPDARRKALSGTLVNDSEASGLSGPGQQRTLGQGVPRCHLPEMRKGRETDAPVDARRAVWRPPLVLTRAQTRASSLHPARTGTPWAEEVRA